MMKLPTISPNPSITIANIEYSNFSFSFLFGNVLIIIGTSSPVKKAILIPVHANYGRSGLIFLDISNTITYLTSKRKLRLLFIPTTSELRPLSVIVLGLF